MAEIHGVVWAIVGVFITIVSLFLGFIRPVDYNAFFQLMLFVGIGMVGYGVIKLKVGKKSVRQKLEERRLHNIRHGRMQDIKEVVIGEDNPNMGQHPGYRQHSQTGQHHPQHRAQHVQHQQHPHAHHSGNSQEARFCSQCGSPLLKNHKFCPLCGTRV